MIDPFIQAAQEIIFLKKNNFFINVGVWVSLRAT
jgi:hypothetical protein